MHNKSRLGVVFVMALSGCQANDQPLDHVIDQIEHQAFQERVALQPSKSVGAVTYEPKHLRVPFELPQEAKMATHLTLRADCWQPEPRKALEVLEHFSLEQLQLKGVIGTKARLSGLIQAPDGTVYTIEAGQYIGRNQGQVSFVSNQYLLIKESLQDGLGCWQRRNVKLTFG